MSSPIFPLPTEKGRRTDSYRVVTSMVALATAALLLVPAEPPAHRVSWNELILPLGVGLPIARGYVLGPPRRAPAGDIVFIARRDRSAAAPATRVEMHVLDRGRWTGVSETRSFSIGWEAPRDGALVTAPEEDANAVRDALVAAIARNDTGFPSVESVPLASEPALPAMSRALDRMAGVRGAAVGVAVTVALVLLASLRDGGIVAGVLLFGLGLALRAANLGVPFVHDQDVQRLFTGGLPLRDILTGAGLEDRHPPLYFVVLHFVQAFGQSEAVGRAPAVLAGALAGPTLLLSARAMCGHIGVPAVVASLAVTISPELIAQSRQVSEIPLFALLLLAAAASLVAAVRAPRPARLLTLSLSHALAMYTYYLTPFVWAAHAVVLGRRRAPRRVVLAFAVGVLTGLPALLLGGVTLLKDWSARDVARVFPALAWGEHAPIQLAAQMGRVVVDALGAPFVALALVVMAVGVARGHLAVVTPAAGAAATFAGIVLLSPIARVQDYYVATIVPLIALALAVAPTPHGRTVRRTWYAAIGLAVAVFTVPLLTKARLLYTPSDDAFMPRFAAAIAQRPETTIVTVAQYDKTILAYYLARAEGRPIGWHTIDASGSKRIEPLVYVHALNADSEANAVRRLEEILRAGPALVIERDAFLLPRIGDRLTACEVLVAAPTARLSRCGGRSPLAEPRDH